MPPDLAALTNARLAEFATWLRETPTRPRRGGRQRSIWGVHGALKDVKIFFRWLVEEEHLAKAPKVPVPRLPQRLYPILSEDDLKRIFASRHVAGPGEMSVRNRALLAVLLDTGIRRAEAARITLADLAVKDGSILIRGKGNKERLVYCSAGAAESLRRWLVIRGDGEGSLVWLKDSGIRMVFKRIQDDTGLPVLTPHQLRHTALTMLVKQNVDLHTVKRIAGHASVTTTESYVALAGEDVRAKHVHPHARRDDWRTRQRPR